MKGLLLKDLRYMLTQKSFILLIVIIGFTLSLTQEDNELFVIGYLAFMGIVLGMTSITMDDQDHNLSFLFTLPLSRRSYVFEKYFFTFLMGALFCCIALAFALITRPFGDYQAPIDEILATTCGTLAGAFLFTNVLIPLQLKFGAERARIASFIAIGGFLAIIFIAALLINVADALPLLQAITSLDAPVLITIGCIILLLCLGVSIKFSLHIMTRKEL
ncbi:MAG: ABC-2 transporter permease [Peptococcaceae bacterium]|nr:ABC-2 transporter permease [Peptococcaceae bacterium]